MPKLSTKVESSVAKLLLIGDSGSGKTGALASLALAGYHLVIFDFDSGLDILPIAIRNQAKTPAEADAAIDRIDYETFTDEYVAQGSQLRVKGIPRAFSEAMKYFGKFPEVGEPSKLGKNSVVVVDSLTLLSQACFNYVDVTTSYKDARQTFFDAQKKIEMLLQMLYSAQFNTNVVVTSHVTYIEVDEGVVRAYPSSMGKALSPKIPRLFNTVLECKSYGQGAAAKKYILTKPSGVIEVKNPLLKLPARLDQTTGLATFFAEFNGQGKAEAA